MVLGLSAALAVCVVVMILCALKLQRQRHGPSVHVAQHQQSKKATVSVEMSNVGGAAEAESGYGPGYGELAVRDNGKLSFEQGLGAIEVGRWDDALCAFDLSISVSGPKVSQGVGDGSTRELLRDAVNYKLAVQVYHECKRLDSDPEIRISAGGYDVDSNLVKLKRLAKLTIFLSTIFVKPKHRVRFIRYSIKLNMRLQNYGLASLYLEMLLRYAKSNRRRLEDEQHECERNARSDANVPVWSCGVCSGEVDVVTANCNSCTAHNRFCYTSLVPLNSTNTLWCPLCFSVFCTDERRKEHSSCGFCQVGRLVRPDADFYTRGT